MKHLFLFGFSLLCIQAWGQVAITPSGAPPHPSAALDVDFNNKGLLLPRLTTQQRVAIANPAAGLIIFNTDLQCPEYFNGVSWMNQCGTTSCQQAPPAPVAQTATGATNNAFTAVWQASAGASLYLLDIATDAQFANLLAGFSGLNVGNVTSYAVTGLTPGATYYYRVRAQNPCGTSGFSNVINLTLSSSQNKRVFLSSQSYTANLGGVSGADNLCQGLATNAGLGGTWRAWISQSGSSPSTRFVQHNGPYVLLNGTVIANNWADLTDGTLLNPINRDETGQTRAVQAWSNTTTSGLFDSASSGGCGGTVCGSWTIGGPCNNPNCGQTGSSSGVSQDWTRGGAACCFVVNHLYCFEQ